MAQSQRICPQCRRSEFDPSVGKIPWRRECLPIPVFLPGEFHGQRSLAGYSPWDWKELDTTEQLIQKKKYLKHHVYNKYSDTGLSSFSNYKYMNPVESLKS